MMASYISKLLGHYCDDDFPAFISQVSQMPDEDAKKIYQILSENHIRKIMGFLPKDCLITLFSTLSDEKVRNAIEGMDIQPLAHVARSIDVSQRQNLLEALDKEKCSKLESILAYGKNEIGSLMEPLSLTLAPEVTVQDALQMVKNSPQRYTRYLYVIDSSRVIIGVVTFKQLFYSRKNETISSLMSTNIVSLRSNISLIDTFERSEWKKYSMLPVIGSSRELVGVLRFDALEKDLEFDEDEYRNDSSIGRAGRAIGEVFGIGIAATLEAFNYNQIEKHKND